MAAFRRCVRSAALVVVVPLAFAMSGHERAPLEFPETVVRPTIVEQPSADYFGRRLATDGDTLAIGYPESDFDGGNSGAVMVFQRAADGWEYRATLRAGDGAPGHLLGMSVAASGSVVAAGATGHRHAGAYSGAAYIFRDVSPTGDWSEVEHARVISAATEGGDRFGYSVSVEGNVLLVGAPYATSQGVATAGTASLFVDTSPGGNWSELTEHVLEAHTPVANGRFGVGVDLLDRNAAVTAPGAVNGLYSTNFGWVFRDASACHDWSEIVDLQVRQAGVATLDPASSDSSIILADERTTMVACPFDYVSGGWHERGRVYIVGDTSPLGDWSTIYVREIRPPWPDSVPRKFAVSMDVDADTLVVGAPYQTDARGAVWRYRDTSTGGDWSSIETSEYPGPHDHPGDRAGSAVALSEGELLVSATYCDDPGQDAGVVHILDRVDPSLPLDELTPLGIADRCGTQFGRRFAAADDTLIISATRPTPARVEIYTRGSGCWEFRQSVTLDQTPEAIAVDGRNAFIGLPYHPDGDRLVHLLDVSSSGDWSEVTTSTITPPVGIDDDQFGCALALRNRELMVGARRGYVPTDGAGSVVVMSDTSPAADWSTYESVILEDVPGLEWDDEFGTAIAVAAGILAVGAPHPFESHQTPGSVHLFRRDPSAPTGWLWLQRVSAYDSGSFDLFGDALSLADERTLVVGAPRIDVDQLADAGAAYIVTDISEMGDWSVVEQHRWIAAQPGESRHCGSAIAAIGATAAIGCPGFYDGLDPRAGALTVVWDESMEEDWTVWSTADVQASDASPRDQFGSELLLDVENLWVSAPTARAEDAENGAVYEYALPIAVSDLQLSGAVTTPPSEPGVEVHLSWTIASRGPDAARRVSLDLCTSGAIEVTQSSTSQGRCNVVDGQAHCDVGRVEPTSHVEITSTLVPLAAGPTAIAGLVTAEAHDPDLLNNSIDFQLDVPIFSDGFESGDVMRWSQVVIRE